MKPSTEITPDILDNSEYFKNDFFNRFELRYADVPLRLNESIEKNYQFPTFYGDVGCAMAVFFCSYHKAKAMLPHPAMEPVSMGKGRALLVFSCYEYRNVLGVAPYNEIAMTIPIMMKPGLSVPVLPMVLPVFRNFGYYCFSMPVTSLENKIRGRKIWGLPKVVEEIPIRREGGLCHIQSIDCENRSYFDLKIPTDGKEVKFDVASYLYSVNDNRLQQSQTNFRGDFKVTKYMGLLLKKGKAPDLDYLTLGEGPSAEVLRNLEIENHPFQFRYCSSMDSCFDLPNPDFVPPPR